MTEEKNDRWLLLGVAEPLFYRLFVDHEPLADIIGASSSKFPWWRLFSATELQ
jgi:hypothetical protein